MRAFGCKCYVHNNGKELYETLMQEVIREYSWVIHHIAKHIKFLVNKSYKTFSKQTMYMEENMHVVFDEFDPFIKKNVNDDD